MHNTSRVYLDWAATAPLCEEAYQAMIDQLRPWPSPGTASYNANSLHSDGRAAFASMEQARKDVAQCLGARPDEVVCTGSATEADYLAVVGIARAVRDKRLPANKDFVARVVTTTIEHEAVAKACDTLAKEGFDIVRVSPDHSGIVPATRIAEAVDDATVLVSVMAANNEIGSIQPISEITRVVHDAGALMHTDAVQAWGKVSLSCREWGVDAASVSAHKIGGPKGCGALYLKSGTPIEPVIVGGGQERGLRGGTQDVASMAGMAAAACAVCASDATLAEEAKRLSLLRDRLYEGMCAHEGVVPSVPCTPGSTEYLPHIVNVCVEGIETETLILQLDLAGFAVSGGSACSSHSLEPSHVLLEVGIPRDLALGSLRVSLGRFTTEHDVDAFLNAFTSVLATQRKDAR